MLSCIVFVGCHQFRKVAHLVKSLLAVADSGLHQQAGHAEFFICTICLITSWLR